MIFQYLKHKETTIQYFVSHTFTPKQSAFSGTSCTCKGTCKNKACWLDPIIESANCASYPDVANKGKRNKKLTGQCDPGSFTLLQNRFSVL